MSYTPPTGNAVDFRQTGVSYTPPLGSAVDFAFGVEFVATGITSTLVVGTPRSAYARSEVVAGIGSTLVAGTPVADFTTKFFVTGVQSSGIGAPLAVYPQFGKAAPCGKATQFGRPTYAGYNYVSSASLGAKVGTPTANTLNWTCHTNAVQLGAVGNPSGSSVVYGRVSGIASTSLGSPSCRYAQFGIVTGIHSTVIGTIRYPLAFEDVSITVLTRANRVEVFTDV